MHRRVRSHRLSVGVPLPSSPAPSVALAVGVATWPLLLSTTCRFAATLVVSSSSDETVTSSVEDGSSLSLRATGVRGCLLLPQLLACRRPTPSRSQLRLFVPVGASLADCIGVGVGRRGSRLARPSAAFFLLKRGTKPNRTTMRRPHARTKIKVDEVLTLFVT